MMLPDLSRRLAGILICPDCRGQLQEERSGLACPGCRRVFNVQKGVPVFLPGEAEEATGHESHSFGAEYQDILEEGRDFVLHLGAGGTAQRYPNQIEFERKVYRHTDVVGDAHHLPFADAVFDRVFAFNVFEHLRDPNLAAQEIHRVLKPGGVVAIHTAFLQPLHDAPHHYFNATEHGVRVWFSDFAIERCHVSGNFSPGMMLGYVIWTVLRAARDSGTAPREILELEGTTLGEWAQFWAGGCAEPPPGFFILQNMPRELQKRVAAGFEFVGRKLPA